MSFLVSMLGLIAAVAGIVAFVFGLSIKEFSFGGTLMITGTIALIGGLLLIAMAAAIRELHRIGTILVSRQPPRFPRPGETHDPAAAGFVRPGANAPHMVPIPVPPVPLHSAPADSGQDEPVRETKFEPATAVETALAQELSARTVVSDQVDDAVGHDASVDNAPVQDAQAHDAPVQEAPAHDVPEDHDIPEDEVAEQAEPDAYPLDAHPLTERAAEPPAELHEPEDIPLSPHEEPFETYIRTAQRDEEPETVPDALDEVPDTVESSVAVEPEPASEPEERPRERGRLSFDAIWPPSERTPSHRYAQSERSRGLDQDEDTPAREAPHITPAEEPETAWSRDHAAGSEPADSPPADEIAEAPHAVSILKSGVVDGMGYALYSDGSIEAALPTGTVRFASINELREHLENAE